MLEILPEITQNNIFYKNMSNWFNMIFAMWFLRSGKIYIPLISTEGKDTMWKGHGFLASVVQTKWRLRW